MHCSNTTQRHVCSLIQSTANLSLTGKYASKQVEQGELSGYSDLYGLGVRYKFTPAFDLALGYRLYSDHKFDTHIHSGTVELGYRILDLLRVSAGYASQALD